MTNLNNNNEANLGRLLFGDRSPMSLHVCLKPIDEENESLISLDPFEMINLGVGQRYFLARLSMGKGFAEQFVLLNIYNASTDKNAVDELSMLERYRDEERIPLPAVIDFNTGYQAIGDLSYSPAFYCSKTRQFFNVACTVCSSMLEYEKDKDCLYCPRCKELSNQHALYSFYECFDNQNVTLLEDLFSQYAHTDSVSENMPCSGCLHAKVCFPDIEKTLASVPNEFHHIIPFSYAPFSVYGFSYYPLNLIEYCELVSGKSKIDLLEKLSKSKESGRHRVLSESGSFTDRLNEQPFLTVESPDIEFILSIKLRVFMRICDAMNRFDSKVDIAGISHAGINMDVAQLYAAGDSFTRAKIGFFPPSGSAVESAIHDKFEGRDASHVQSVPATLSDILLNMLFKNEKNNELEIKKAVDDLISRISSRSNVSLGELESAISDSNKTASVFSVNSLRYYDAASTSDIKSQLNRVVLKLVRLGLILSQQINAEAFISQSMQCASDFSFAMIIDEIKKIFDLVDEIRESQSSSRKSEESDQQLLESALREIINDEPWLNSLFPHVSFAQGLETPFAENVYDNDNDKTLIAPADDSELDKTIMQSRSLSDDVEADDVMIMSSINRILRHL